MINPVEYLRMVHTVTSVVTVDGAGLFTINTNPNRIGLSVGFPSGGTFGLLQAQQPIGTPVGSFLATGTCGDVCFSWLMQGTLPSMAFSGSGFTAGDTIVVTELILRPEQTDQISRG